MNPPTTAAETAFWLICLCFLAFTAILLKSAP